MTSHPHIGLNATLIHNSPSGLGVYTHELLLEMLAAQCEFDFMVYTSSSRLRASFPGRIASTSPLTSPD